MNHQLSFYCELIRKFNKTLNLVSPKDLDTLEARHISDATTSLRIFMDIYGNPNAYSAYDLGSGNGIPGIVWSILNPSATFTLVEIDQRKSEFLKHCVRELSLSNCTVSNADFYKSSFPAGSIILARAFMNLNKLFASNSPILSHECFLIKGSTWNNELIGIEEISFNSYPYKTDSGAERALLHYKPTDSYN
jgi:16S rRNA (guanine527-N7)-methyltransferase